MGREEGEDAVEGEKKRGTGWRRSRVPFPRKGAISPRRGRGRGQSRPRRFTLVQSEEKEEGYSMTTTSRMTSWSPWSTRRRRRRHRRQRTRRMKRYFRRDIVYRILILLSEFFKFFTDVTKRKINFLLIVLIYLFISTLVFKRIFLLILFFIYTCLYFVHINFSNTSYPYIILHVYLHF